MEAEVKETDVLVIGGGLADVLRIDETTKKPVIKYLSDCQSCFLCERDCPQEAIYVTPFRERRIPLPW